MPFSRNVLCLVENKDFLTSYLLSCRNIISKKNGCFLIFWLIVFFWIAENFSSQRFSSFCTSLQRQICVHALLWIEMDSLKRLCVSHVESAGVERCKREKNFRIFVILFCQFGHQSIIKDRIWKEEVFLLEAFSERNSITLLKKVLASLLRQSALPLSKLNGHRIARLLLHECTKWSKLLFLKPCLFVYSFLRDITKTKLFSKYTVTCCADHFHHRFLRF